MLRIRFNPDAADLEYLAGIPQQSHAPALAPTMVETIAAAHAVLDKARQAQVAGFIAERYSRLDRMLAMVADPQWRLEGDDLTRVLNALACLGASGTAPGLFECAIMIELISSELRHELDAYADFCRFRDSLKSERHGAPAADRAQWLQERGASLRARAQQRRKRDLQVAGSAVRSLVLRFGRACERMLSR